MCAKIITIKRTKDLNYFSLCALNLFNTQVSHLELNYWNKWTFPRHSSLLRCTCISFQSVQIYTLLYVGYWLKETFWNVWILRIWSISQSAPFSHCKAMIDKMVHNSGPYFIWYAPLSLVSSASSSVLPLPCILSPLLPLVCWPWSFSGCSSIVRIVLLLCCPLSIYASNWRFMRCTFELFQITGL